jgi:predicted branched-subunit amino acid permease
MNKKTLSQLTNEELLVEKKKLKKRKITNALMIGFLVVIVGFGIVAWILGSKKNLIAFLLQMIFPIYFIYFFIKKSKNDKNLEIVLKEQNLN